MAAPSGTFSLSPMNQRVQQYVPATLYVTILVTFLSAWQWRTTGHLSVSTVTIFAAFSSAALIYGRFFLRLSPLPPTFAGALTPQFVFGFLLFNTGLLVLSLAFAYGVAICFLILVAAAPVMFFIRGKRSKIEPQPTSQVPDLLCLLISGAGATLWCTDALSPIVVDGQNTVFKLWQDSFWHMRIISTFAQSHGLETLSDIRMAGARPFLYHYASYLTPAAIVSLTGARAFDAFAGFQLPFGLLLTGLAAFALAASLWGPWAGLAATWALLLLPDAYQQGFAHRYLSYNFLQQVNLAGLYGVACAAAAWVFILHGCRSGKYSSIIIGYALVLLTAAYKSQIFVANALLAIVYPCLFFVGLRASWRSIVATALLFLFVVAIWLSQKIDGVPPLRPDFSFQLAVGYAINLLQSFDPGFFKSVFSWLIYPPDRPRVIVGLSVAGMILLCSLGMWSVAFGLMFLRLRRKTEPALLFFPLLLIVNYLVMALGLSLNTGSGASDEFQNRPLVWVYFGVVSWTSGAAYACAFGKCPPRGHSVRLCVVVLVLSSFVVPWRLARDLQTFPAWRGYAGFDEFASFPSCLINAAQYIREQSQPGNVIQDSENDAQMFVGAFAEREEFADNWIFGEIFKGTALKERINDLRSFKEITNQADLLAFARKNKISWYLLRPETKVSWPKSFLSTFSFDCDGYRVYRFPIR